MAFYLQLGMGSSIRQPRACQVDEVVILTLAQSDPAWSAKQPTWLFAAAAQQEPCFPRI